MKLFKFIELMEQGVCRAYAIPMLHSVGSLCCIVF